MAEEPAPLASQQVQTIKLINQAASYERLKQPLKAAEIYERIVEREPLRKIALAPRLATIYAQHGQEDKALTWARVVMERNPEPRAYLAGIYTVMERYDEASGILRKELKQATESRRIIVLNWQLADVYDAQNKQDLAEACLVHARKVAHQRPEQNTALKRLQEFREKYTIAENQEHDARRNEKPGRMSANP